MVVLIGKALRCCARPGCPILVPSGYCEAHARTPWAQAYPVTRTRGRALQRLRADLFDRYPLCVLCLQQGRHRPSVIRDHIVPLFEGGQDTETNVQALCQECSDAKTIRESTRARQSPVR